MRLLMLIFLFTTPVSFAQSPKVDTLVYDEIFQFQDGFALTLKDRKYGIINSNLELIIPPILEEFYNYDLSPYFFYNELFGVLDGKSVVFDTLGNIVKNYDMLLSIEELLPHRLLSQENKVDSYIIRTGSNLYDEFGSSDWGCVTINGDTIVPFTYNFVETGTASSFIGINRIERKTYSSQIYSADGNKQKFHDGLLISWPNGNCIWKQTEGGFIATDSNLVAIDSNYYEWVYVFENLCWVKSEGLWYTLNLKFEKINSTESNYFGQNKYWSFSIKNERVTLYNSNGIRISPFIYEGEWNDYTSNSKFILTRKGEYYYVLDSQGVELKKFVLKKSKAYSNQN